MEDQTKIKDRVRRFTEVNPSTINTLLQISVYLEVFQLTENPTIGDILENHLNYMLSVLVWLTDEEELIHNYSEIELLKNSGVITQKDYNYRLSLMRQMYSEQILESARKYALLTPDALELAIADLPSYLQKRTKYGDN